MAGSCPRARRGGKGEIAAGKGRVDTSHLADAALRRGLDSVRMYTGAELLVQQQFVLLQ